MIEAIHDQWAVVAALVVFVVATISATLLPMGSEPVVFGLVKMQPEMFWPAVLVATAGNTLGDAVLDRIFHQGLEQQSGHLSVADLLRDIDAHLQTFAEADLLNVEIALQIFHFLGQRHLRTVGILRRTSQELAESDDHVHRRVAPLFAHEAGDRIERVEHEMRLHLSAQGRELSSRKLLVEPRRTLAGIPHESDNPYQRVDDQVRQHLIGE